MQNEIRLPAPLWDDLRAHLLQNDLEQLAVVFAKPAVSDDGVRFDYQHHDFLAPTDFEVQASYHISLTDEARQRIIKMAWDSDSSIVELHSHRGPYCEPQFSPSDLAGFDSFVPHVWWRLRGKPYAAVVLTETGFDCLVWRFDPRRPEPIRAIVIGDQEKTPTNWTILSLRRSYVRRPL